MLDVARRPGFRRRDGLRILERWTDEVESSLCRLLEQEVEPVGEGPRATLRDAVLSPGKRLRPLLLLAAYRSAGGRHDSAPVLACSVEFLHAHSLVHDDLPCMDDDPVRRGAPALHVRYGAGPALVAGAALLPIAFRAVAVGSDALGLPVEIRRQLVSLLAEAAGLAGMAGGQLADLRTGGACRDAGTRERIHQRKTAALLRASARMGAVAGGAPPELADRLAAFGLHMGMALQARDDLEDLFADRPSTGDVAVSGPRRPARASDAAGRGATRSMAAHRVRAGRELLRALPDPEPLALLLRRAVRREGLT